MAALTMLVPFIAQDSEAKSNLKGVHSAKYEFNTHYLLPG